MQKRVRKEESMQFCGDMQAAQERYGVGYHSIKKIAKECDAEIRIGRSVRYNFSKMDSYLNKVGEVI